MAEYQFIANEKNPGLKNIVYNQKKTLLVGAERSGKTQLIIGSLKNEDLQKVLYIGKEDDIETFCDTLGFELAKADSMNPIDAWKRVFLMPSRDTFEEVEDFEKCIDMYADAGYFLIFDKTDHTEESFLSAYKEKRDTLSSGYDHGMIIAVRSSLDHDAYLPHMDQVFLFRNNSNKERKLFGGAPLMFLNQGEFMAFHKIGKKQWRAFPGIHKFRVSA